jgi:uncharacterized protein
LTDSGNANATLRIFPRLNHLFLPSPTGAVSEYGALELQSLPDEVLTSITEWLARTLRASVAGAVR